MEPHTTGLALLSSRQILSSPAADAQLSPLAPTTDAGSYGRRDDSPVKPTSDRVSNSRMSRQASSLGTASEARPLRPFSTGCGRWLCGLCSFPKHKSATRTQTPCSITGPTPSTPARRSNPSDAGRAASSTAANIASNSTACSSDSHVGPLPSRPLSCIPREEAGTYIPEGRANYLDPPEASSSGQAGGWNSGLRLSTPSSANSGPPGGVPKAVNTRGVPGAQISGGGGGRGAGGAAACGGSTGMSNPLAVSRASSMASYTSGITTTSRPSRWGMLAGLLSAGLRSFTQLANIVEPNTGSLTAEAVHDLTRHASRLDVERAVCQVSDLSLVGAGSMGLVYRGRVSDTGRIVCVKYLVARGADGMAAPATEGLLSRALAHPNIVMTYSWHVTRVTSENFLDLQEAMAAMAARETRKAAKKGPRGGLVRGLLLGGGGGVHSSSMRHTAAGVTICSITNSSPLTTYGEGQGSMSRSHGRRPGSSQGYRQLRRGTRPLGSGTFTVHVLDMVRTSTSARTVSHAAPASPNGGGLATRLRRQAALSFSALSTRSGSFAATVGAASVGRQASTPASAAGVGPFEAAAVAHEHEHEPLLPPSLPSAASLQQRPALQQQQHRTVGRALEVDRGIPAELLQAGNLQTDVESSWSMRHGEAYDSYATSSILQQAAACDAAAVAAAAAAANMVAMVAPVPASGTTVTWFSRDSLSSHWFGPSPNPSNHPATTVSSSAHNPVRGGYANVSVQPFGAGSTPSGGAAGPPHSPPMPIRPLSGGRGRATLVRVGSRLQFVTPGFAQPSIPEDTQADEGLEGCSMSRSNPSGSNLFATLGGMGALDIAAATAGGAVRQRLLEGVVGSADLGYVPSLASSAGRPAPAFTVLTPAAAVAESVGGSSSAGGGSVDSPVLSRLQQVRRREKSFSPASMPRHDLGHRRGSTSSLPRGSGLLAVALAAQARVPSSGQVSSSNGRSGGMNLPSGVGAGVVVSSGGGVARGSMVALHEIRPIGSTKSRSGSAVLTRMTTSSKRLSSAATERNMTSSATLHSGATGGAAAAAVVAAATPPGVTQSRGAGVSTPSMPGSGGVAVTSSSSSAATVHHIGSEGSSADVGGAPPPEAVRPEVLEQGWRTLQQIMQRLNARPGDYLTRIVMEDADRGSLLSALRSGQFLSAVHRGEGLRALLLTAVDIARGMAFLHGHAVIHGDLKPSNVLLCSDSADPRGFVAKVSDFGLSRIISRDHDFVQNPDPFPPGTVSYMAPEAVTGSSFRASDVWSYGVVLWQLVTGELVPWPGLRHVQIIMGIMQNELRLSVPPSTYPPLGILIESCLAHNHQLRPTFDDVVQKLQAMLRDFSREACKSASLDALNTASMAASLSSFAGAAGEYLRTSSVGPIAAAVPPAVPPLPAPRAPGFATSVTAGPPSGGSAVTDLPTGAADAAAIGSGAGGGTSANSSLPSLAPSDIVGEATPRLAGGAAGPEAAAAGAPAAGSAAGSSDDASGDAGAARKLSRGDLAALQPSLVPVSSSLTTTAAASSHALSSSSWANTATTNTTNTTNILAGDQRSSAWQSGAGLRWSTAGFDPGSLSQSRATASTGVDGSACLAMERQCLQELFSRQGRRDSVGGAQATEDLPGTMVFGRIDPMAAGLVSLSRSSAGSAGPLALRYHTSGVPGFGFGVGVGMGDLNQGAYLAPVHEEQSASSSSGYPTGIFLRSVSGGVGQVPTTSASDASRRPPGSPAIHGSVAARRGSSEQGTLPSMLQAGLIVLGGRGSPGPSSLSNASSQQTGSELAWQ